MLTGLAFSHWSDATLFNKFADIPLLPIRLAHLGEFFPGLCQRG